MKSATTISAVVPTRNRSVVLRRALASIRSQTRPPDEIIVVDDGSVDDTSRWIRSECPDVRYLRQRHAGVSAARNRGVRAAGGEWIAFLDSDDEWRPAKLERQLDAVTAASSHAICHTDEIWIREGRRVNPGRRHEKAGGRIFRRCLPLCAISPSSVMIRRELLEEVGGFDEAFPVCEDYDLWLRICSRYPVLYLDEPLVVKYGGHADQLSHRYWGMDRFRIRAIEKVLAAGVLDAGDRRAALRALLEKIDVYLLGARRRDKRDVVAEYERRRRRLASELQSLGSDPRNATPDR